MAYGHGGTGPELVEFGGLAIRSDSRVLRPRQWTLAQAIWANALLATAPPGPVLEVCAGVGHIGLAATAGTHREIVLVDVNPVACELARANAAAAGMDSCVDVREGRMEDVLHASERFALIIADPPWVRSADTGRFPKDPVIAIDGGGDGLGPAMVCCDVIQDHLEPGGDALLQLGSADQVAALQARLGDRLTVQDSRTYEAGVVVRLTG